MNPEISPAETRGDEIDQLKREIAELDARGEALLNQVLEQQMLLDLTPAQITVKHRDHTYYIVNQNFAEFVGREVEAIHGLTDLELFDQDTANARMARDDAVMEAGQQQLNSEETITRPDGSTCWIETHRVPFLDADGQALGLVTIALDITQRKQAEELLKQRESEMSQIVEQQQRLIETIRVLSAPVLPISDHTLVLPLIGYIDSERSLRITETLLEAVQRDRAHLVIIDITGVPMVDTAVAGHLIKTARAIGLLGARCMLVGISPEIAQTLVQLGVELSELIIRRDLRDAMTYALSRR